MSGGINTFDSNSVVNGYGGAIGIYGAGNETSVSTIKLSGGTNIFTNNSVTSSNTELGNGGAIAYSTIGDDGYTDDGEDITGVQITGGENTFKNNTANYNGGAIYSTTGDTDSDIVPSVIISGGNNVFDTNIATNGNGGAIYAQEIVDLSGGSNNFKNNSSTNGNGGAISSEQGVLIEGGNHVFDSNTAAKGYGGAIYAEYGVQFSGKGTVATFTGNQMSDGKGGTRLNDIYINDVDYGSVQFSDAGKYSFSGGIISPEISINSDANVTIEAGSYTSTGVFILNGGNLTIDLKNNTQVQFDNDGYFQVMGSTQSDYNGPSSMTVYSTIENYTGTPAIDRQVIMSTGKSDDMGISSLGGNIVILSKEFKTETGYAVYGLVEQLGNDVIVQLHPAEQPIISVNKSTILAKTIKAVYENTKDDSGNVLSNQEIILTSDTKEGTEGIFTDGPTVLVNDSSNQSTLNLHSNTTTARTVESKVTGTTVSPIFKNTSGDTHLIANNITFEGYTLDATGKNVYLSGKNITMKHKTGELDSHPIITADTLYLQNADITFGSTVAGSMEADANTVISIGVGSTVGELEITGNLTTTNGTVINLDIFQTGSDYKTASGNDSLKVDCDLVLDPNTKINLIPQFYFGNGEEFWVKFTSANSSEVDMQTILDKLEQSGPFIDMEYVSKGGAYYIHGRLVPEPSTWALLILGVAGLMWLRKRNK